MEKTFIICNPAAGEGRAHDRWPRLFEDLNKNGFDFDYQLTSYPKHATEIARTQVKKGIKRLAVFGGDGTLNETIQGLMDGDKVRSKDLNLIYLPAGSSCDFAKKFPGKRTFLERLNATRSQAIDLCKIECHGDDGSSVTHYFINNSSIGLISLGNLKFNSVKGISKRIKRLNVDAGAIMAGLGAILEFKGITCSLRMDDEELDDLRLTNLTVFKTPYFGGGMYYGVETFQDDGLLNVAIVEAQSRLKLVAIIPTLYTGKIFKKECAYHRTCTELTIDVKEKIIIETDGESIGYSPARYSILKRAVNVIV
ncbi:MAG: diacylglycerol kinase family protein [Candidatus Neomarinimicrobiota bacterium]